MSQNIDLKCYEKLPNLFSWELTYCDVCYDYGKTYIISNPDDKTEQIPICINCYVECKKISLNSHKQVLEMIAEMELVKMK